MSGPLRIGPQRPDEIAGRSTGTRVDAMDVIQAVQSAYPPELRAAMQRQRDEVASAALDVEALSAEYGVKVVAAAVYGLRGTEQTVVYLFEDDSGRTGRWFAPLEESPLRVDVEKAHKQADREVEEFEADQAKATSGSPPGMPDPPTPTRDSTQPAAQVESDPPPTQPQAQASLQADPAAQGEPGEADPTTEPWAGYDERTVAEITSELPNSSDEELHHVKAYEAAHKNRVGVISEADRLLAE